MFEQGVLLYPSNRLVPCPDRARVSFLFVQLDAGTDERIMLVARDEQSVLVVSYQDVKACVESAFSYVFLVSSLFIEPSFDCLVF